MIDKEAMLHKGEDLAIEFCKTFDNPSGESVLSQLARISDARCTQFSVPPTGTIDPNLVIYREGMRSMYWYIVGVMENGRKLMASRTKALVTTKGNT